MSVMACTLCVLHEAGDFSSFLPCTESTCLRGSKLEKPEVLNIFAEGTTHLVA